MKKAATCVMQIAALFRFWFQFTVGFGFIMFSL